MTNAEASTTTAERGKGERGGLVPILKGFDAIKHEFAEFKKRIDEIEKQQLQTNGKVQGVLAGAIVECPECEGLLQAEKFPKHWLKLHAPKSEPAEMTHAEFVKIFDEGYGKALEKNLKEGTIRAEDIEKHRDKLITQAIVLLAHECEKRGMCKLVK